MTKPVDRLAQPIETRMAELEELLKEAEGDPKMNNSVLFAALSLAFMKAKQQTQKDTEDGQATHT